MTTSIRATGGERRGVRGAESTIRSERRPLQWKVKNPVVMNPEVKAQDAMPRELSKEEQGAEARPLPKLRTEEQGAETRPLPNARAQMWPALPKTESAPTSERLRAARADVKSTRAASEKLRTARADVKSTRAAARSPYKDASTREQRIPPKRGLSRSGRTASQVPSLPDQATIAAKVPCPSSAIDAKVPRPSSAIEEVASAATEDKPLEESGNCTAESRERDDSVGRLRTDDNDVDAFEEE